MSSLYCVVLACALADAPAEVRIVTLGDSITRGVRAGVKPDETFSAYLQVGLREKKIHAKVINAGIGGERTDQALARLDRVLKEHKPHLVTIMYGHNDSHIDRGRKEPRLTIDQFEKNLRTLVERLDKAGVKVVLMTPPCYSRKSRQGGSPENPNVQLVKCADVCRKVARDLKKPVIDHYAFWHKRLDDGGDVQDWTTDGYHANPRGHREMAAIMQSVIVEALKSK